VAEAARLRQPTGLFLLFVVEMWERFSYYGMRALLVLYLTTPMLGMKDKAPGFNPGRGWQEGHANLLYGWYTGLAYLLPILGGLIADRFLGTHRSMVIGGVTIALGHIMLAVSGIGDWAHNAVGMGVFIFGLALIITGTGYFKPCVSVMVGQLYKKDDPRRDGGFTIFYMGINLGAFLCAFVCGTLGEKVGWHWGFGSAAVGMLAGLCCYLLGRPTFLHDIGLPPAGRDRLTVPLVSFLGAAGLAATAAVAYGRVDFTPLQAAWHRFMAVSPDMSWLVPGALLAVVVIAVAWFVAIQKPGEKGPTACIFIFVIFNAFFWLAFEQAGSTLNLFARDRTDRLILGWQMPASWFQSVNPLLIIVLAPLFAMLWSRLGKRGLDPSQPIKISLGLLLLGAGYIFMVFGARSSDTGLKVGMYWLLATYTLHTFGELCLSPTGLSFVTKTAPLRFVSLLMGVWFLSNFVANLGGGIVASYVEKVERGELFKPILGGRADFFLVFVVSSVAGGLVILLLTPLLKRMLHGRG